MNLSNAIITVDIGNSFIKFGFFNKLSLNDKFPIPASTCIETTTSFSDMTHWLEENFNGFVQLHWEITSVNEKRTKSLQNWLERHRAWDTFCMTRVQDLPMPIQYDHPDKLGIDRAVAAYAALQLLGHLGPVLVVDIGTATTIDFVDEQGIYSGGAILPGPRIAAEALFARTERLPRTGWEEIQSDYSLNYPATNTEDAIRVGICASQAGAIMTFYLKILAQYRQKQAKRGIQSIKDEPLRSIPIIIAERGSNLLEMQLRTLFEMENSLFGNYELPSIRTCPHLVLSGLAALIVSKKEKQL